MRDNGIRRAGISQWRYRELRAVCRQYGDKHFPADKAEMIRHAAQQADPVNHLAILKNVTRGVRYEEAGFYGDRSGFYRARTKFFVELDINLKLRGSKDVV